MSAPYDRPATEPGGMECTECGVIFVGAEWHDQCAVCATKKGGNQVGFCAPDFTPSMEEQFGSKGPASMREGDGVTKLTRRELKLLGVLDRMGYCPLSLSDFMDEELCGLIEVGLVLTYHTSSAGINAHLSEAGRAATKE